MQILLWYLAETTERVCYRNIISPIAIAARVAVDFHEPLDWRRF
jgi:hypothetical protein